MADSDHPGHMTSLWVVNAGLIVHYFLMDRLAFGVAGTYRLVQGAHLDAAFLGAGPGFTAFPYIYDRLAIKLGGGVYWEHVLLPAGVENAGTRIDLNAGTQYFITPAVAMGPTFSLDFTSGSRFAGDLEFSLGGGLSIYL